ncbi:MAG: PP0621 family protein [Gallionella sp.]|nr:PP0621 family protein [Gallionella sp.]
MARLILFLAIIFVIYLILRVFWSKNPNAGDHALAEDMVQCAYCGVHLPKSEGLQEGGQYFCNEAHRDAFVV